MDGKVYNLVSTLLQLNARTGNKAVRRCGELKGGLCDHQDCHSNRNTAKVDAIQSSILIHTLSECKHCSERTYFIF